MLRMAARQVSGTGQSAPSLQFDSLRVGLLGFHLVVIGFVALGWLIPSRGALYFYTLLLPMIAAQWLLNGGVSIVNNVENLIRAGRWNDPGNGFEGTFFKTFLDWIGVPASQAQITTVLCFLMLMFWISALCHMILIVPPVQT